MNAWNALLPTVRDRIAHSGLLIDGGWIHNSEARSFDSFNPSTGEQLGSMIRGEKRDVGAAVAAAWEAFRDWSRVSVFERASIIMQVADRIDEHRDELALIESLDTGMPFRYARNDVTKGAARLRYFAGLSQEIKGQTIPADRKSFQYTVRQPLGVVAVINPFNHPLMFALSKIAAPLAAGNSVVLKPPEQAPLSSIELGRIINDLIPAGVFNIVTGFGAEAGALLVEHPQVQKVSFTGSVQTGQAILRAAATNLTRVLLELGGKNAFIVFEDADVSLAVEGAVKGLNLGIAGQSCQSGTRLFIHDSVYETFTARLVDRLQEIGLGSPLDEGTELAPLISQDQYDRVTDYIVSGKREGASLIYGGCPPSDSSLHNGYYLLPAVFTGVEPDMRIWREEIFGPVLGLRPWHSFDDMIQEVNDSSYGLTASVWTKDLATTHKAIDCIEAGYVYVNQHGGSSPGVPFGGWKHSGLGLEHSLDEMFELTQVKSVDMRLTALTP